MQGCARMQGCNLHKQGLNAQQRALHCRRPHPWATRSNSARCSLAHHAAPAKPFPHTRPQPQELVDAVTSVGVHEEAAHFFAFRILRHLFEVSAAATPRGAKLACTFYASCLRHLVGDGFGGAAAAGPLTSVPGPLQGLHLHR